MTSHVPIGSQDFEPEGGQLPYVDVVHAAGAAVDVDQVDQGRPPHWRPREPKIDNWCENHGPYIKGSRLHVLKAIGSYAQLNTGIAVVSIEKLAQVCQLHPRQVRRIIRDLASKGMWFVIVERPRGDKPGHSNEYHLLGAATYWAPLRVESNAFETEIERTERHLRELISLATAAGVEVPEELLPQAKDECPTNDERGESAEGTFMYVLSVSPPPTPDHHEDLNHGESSSSSPDKPKSHATEEDFADAREVVAAAWDQICQKVNRDTGEITRQGWRDKKHAIDRLAWDREQREVVRAKLPDGRKTYALDPGTAEYQEAKAVARNAARDCGETFDVDVFTKAYNAERRQDVAR